ncbi:hypothetical protein AQJ23_44865 [Streptomyces antibioticus]|nr:hypothetical protein [Streptomyces antibioticus]KUN16529.1 hypothetical protein AQJ23_44865 [Streptomyces antibioticus]
MTDRPNPASIAAAGLLTLLLSAALGVALLVLAVTHPLTLVLAVVGLVAVVRVVRRLRRK